MDKEYIEREAALETLSYNTDGLYDTLHIFEAQDRIAALPAADVAPVRRGRWNGEGDGYADGELVLDVWRCSECEYCIDDGTVDPLILPNCCPNCGARMNSEPKEAHDDES